MRIALRICLFAVLLTFAYGLPAGAQNKVGVPTTYGDAMRWYGNAAKAGHPQAQFYLGYMYETGVRIAKDTAKAALWYRRAGEQGHVQAQYNLAQLYLRGDGVLRDPAAAAAWYRRAAGAGMLDAQYALAALLEAGDGLAVDLREAAEWYQRAADQGSAGAANNLAILLMRGEVIEREVSRALELYRFAAEAGLANAQFNLAAAYISGEGIEPDYVLAHRWLKASANQDQVTAVADQARRILPELEKRMTPEQGARTVISCGGEVVLALGRGEDVCGLGDGLPEFCDGAGGPTLEVGLARQGAGD